MKIFESLIRAKGKSAADKMDAAFDRLHRAIHNMLSQHNNDTIIVLPIKHQEKLKQRL